MVQISKKKLPEEILSKLFILFFEVVGKKDKNDEFEQIINDLFSETERIMIIKRIAIIYLLMKNIEQRVIGEVLRVSPSTVSKFSIISQKSRGIIPYINRIAKRDKAFEMFEDFIASVFQYPGRYGIDWKAAWRTKREIERKKYQGI